MTAALQALLDRVEAGEFPADTSARDLGIASDGLPIIKTMYSAFSGSLDAAKALHEAVIPNHAWDIWRGIGADCVRYYGCNLPGIDTAYHEDPARAWLIAILRAMIAASVAENEGGV